MEVHMNGPNLSSVDVVLSNRSEVAHLSPVIKELREQSHDSVRIITIHEQGSSIKEMLNDLDISPDVCWTVRGTEERHGLLLAEVYMLLNELWSTAPASWLMNYGYSKFTYPCVSAAFQNDVAVAHIHDSDSSVYESRRRFRLEKIVSTISDAHFTTSVNIKNRLIAEGINEKEIFSVGSTIPDFGREVLGYRILDQQVNTSFRELINKTFDTFSRTKIVAFEIDSSSENFRDFCSLITDHSDFRPDFKVILFSNLEFDVSRNIKSCWNTQDTSILSLSHWDRCFLFTKSFCVLSKSSETIDEARAFGALGLLLGEQTKRFDLLSDGQVSLGGNQPKEWLSRLKALATKSVQERGSHSGQLPFRASRLSASQQITNAITNRTSETAQKSRT